ncbi:transcriptional regulator [Helicobacter japonicus]|uniref:transcriptional regulator n=1 Tax=Helicobacter japonicus TaxID=425400 RepID=UPI000AA2BD22|nr:transcriptional regulator [Helicobacter japonicus]
MQYVLKNKDKVVLEFEVETIRHIERGVEISKDMIKNIQLFNISLAPINLDINNPSESLESFIKHRKAPSHRQYVQKIIASYSRGEERLMDYIDVSFGLSLNDSYWIIPSDKDYKWRDFNLYQHAFNEALELIAFGIGISKISGITLSPEYTTNGMLKKCWHKENNKIFLYKGGSPESDDGEEYGGKEAYSEYYMTQIAEIMEFEHINYDLKMFHNQLVSTCPIFTNENEGYIPIFYLLEKKDRKLKGVDLVDKLEVIYDKDKLEDLFLFDALICNIDRHLGNFGMIVDNNTRKILRPAPIFDNGCSILNLLYKSDLQDIASVLLSQKSYLEFSFNRQLKTFAQQRHIPNLEKLSNFTFQRHKEFNLSEEWLKPIESNIQQRAKMALRFIEEKYINVTDEVDISQIKDEIQITIVRDSTTDSKNNSSNNTQQEPSLHTRKRR